ncbi:hypothetical protein [Sinorhizobium meliloti]|uniref:hypothetical protein n=1 Tax=Rhizobium meliloti TaxID=382 RepID=UPI0013E37DA2|nr:hypothetical protein [Sinorhizobium meliloti]
MPDPRLQRYQRQLLISFEPPRLLGLPASERWRLVSNLATLLIVAATGMKEEERNDDHR